MIGVSLPEAQSISLMVYDMYGSRRVARVFEGNREAGRSVVKFDASSFSSGMYYAVLQTLTQAVNRLMVVGR